MPDWVRYVREKLPLKKLSSGRGPDVVQELAEQLEEFYEEALSRGCSPRKAREHAARQIQDWERLASDLASAERPERWFMRRLDGERRSGRLTRLGDSLLRDASYACKSLRRNPLFALVTVVVLSLGIAAATAIFGIANELLLAPLPYPEPHRLVIVQERFPASGYSALYLTEGEYVTLRSEARSLQSLGVYYFRTLTMQQDEGSARVIGSRVTAGLFDALESRPLLGRTFTSEEERKGAPVAVLSHFMWRERFGGAADVLGQVLRVDGESRQIIGVMPKNFRLPAELNSARPVAAFYLPLSIDGSGPNWGSHYHRSIARLAPDASLPRAQAEVEAIIARIAQEYPANYDDPGFRIEVSTLRENLSASARPILTMLGLAAGIVLLVACMNVANLLLARTTSRENEIGVRLIMGATRFRLVRQLLTEGLLLSLASAAGGLLLAWLGLDAIRSLASGYLPRARNLELDGSVFLFALGASVVALLLFGLAPAVRAAGAAAVASSPRTSGLPSQLRIRRHLVRAEVALALALVVCSGLLIRTVFSLGEVDLGFRPQNLLTLQLTLPREQYAGSGEIDRFLSETLETVRGLPGVVSASAANRLPLQGFGGDSTLEIDGLPETGDETSTRHVAYRRVMPGYFETMGTPLLQGREVDPSDQEDTPLVAIVNDTVARRFFPGGDALGRRIRLRSTPGGHWATIVGVAADARKKELDEAEKGELYFPVAQSERCCDHPTHSMALVVRAVGEPAAAARPVRAAVWRIDRAIPVDTALTMEEIVARELERPRANALLSGFFAVVTLILASLGVYGVLSYSVRRRSREIGIRMAVGAGRGQIFRLFLGEGLRLAVSGMALGSIAALAASRFLAGLLYGVGTTDLATWIAVSLILLLVALLASSLPARKAMEVDPVEALRRE